MSAPPAEPLYFGPSEEPLFGWLHRAPGDGPPALGLVICNPFGFEEVCAHRSLRALAQAAAGGGVPALRFDYAGCGNSHGSDRDPGRVASWLASTQEAIAALRRATGVDRVALLGVRLGALLAALAARERDDVAGLVAVAPVVSGRAYLRELRILGETLDSTGRPMPADPQLFESAGFCLAADAVAELEAIDLRKLPGAPAARVLVVGRDDLPAPDDWPAQLERSGVQVSRADWSGYAGMMADPQRAQVPHALIDGVVSTLLQWRSTAAPGAAGGPIGSTAVWLDGLHESLERIDADGVPLFGVLIRPAAAAPRVGILMLNSGSVHHIGPNRLWVELARDWAARGAAVLRLDLSGIGDSPARPGADENIVYSPHAAADIAAALARLRASTGVDDCRLLGLCSGAFHAFKAAVADQPVQACLMVNPLTFFWDPRWVTNEGLRDYEPIELMARYRRLAFTRHPWRKLLALDLDLGAIAAVAARRLTTLARGFAAETARRLGLPLRDDLARDIEKASGAGRLLHFVFSAGDPGLELLQLQGGRTVRRLEAGGRLTIALIDGADHTFTRRARRDMLVSQLDRLAGLVVAEPTHPETPPIGWVGVEDPR
ncbi:MAG TPA: alpha/beta fold hydrolase [Methylibium sp.]|nr:alpha/beta fold hydrolase [Methylibium sp.]